MSMNVNPDRKYKENTRALDDPDRFMHTLDPVIYEYSTCPCDKPHMGLMVSPTAVLEKTAKGHISFNGSDGIRIVRHDDEYMRVSESELIAILWAKVRQLSDRLAAIESPGQG